MQGGVPPQQEPRQQLPALPAEQEPQQQLPAVLPQPELQQLAEPQQLEPQQQLSPLPPQLEPPQHREEHQWVDGQQQQVVERHHEVQQQQQQQPSHCSQPAFSAAEAAAAAAAAAPAPRAHAALAEMQRRVFDQLAWSAQDVQMMQHCVRRAQQASPACAARTPLGVLPSVRLQLPEDPPGMLHAVSCLLEAVAPPLPDDAGAAAAGGATLRLTVFASAGAVACWHEAPANPAAPLAFSPLTRAPYWGTEPGGFSLHFPHPFCPQIDLFSGIHQYVAALGPAALLWPTAGLTGWEWAAAAPVVVGTSGAQLEQQAQQVLMGQASVGTAPALSPAPPQAAPSLRPSPHGASSGAAAASPAAATPSRHVQQRGLASPTHVGTSLGPGGSSLGTLQQLSLPHTAAALLLPALPDMLPALPGLSCFLDPRA